MEKTAAFPGRCKTPMMRTTILGTLRRTVTVRPSVKERSRDQNFFVSALRVPQYLFRRRDLATTAAVSLHETLDEIDRAQSRERRRLRSDHANRRARKMRRGCKLENVRDVAQIVARI